MLIVLADRNVRLQQVVERGAHPLEGWPLAEFLKATSGQVQLQTPDA